MGLERLEPIARGVEASLELLVAGHQNLAPRGRRGAGVAKERGRARFRHHHLGPGVLEEVLDLVLLETWVGHDHGRAQLQRAEERGHPIDAVIQSDEDPLLGLDALGPENPREPIGAILDVGVGVDAIVRDQGPAISSPFADPGIEAVVGEVDEFGNIRGQRRGSPFWCWTPARIRASRNPGQ